MKKKLKQKILWNYPFNKLNTLFMTCPPPPLEAYQLTIYPPVAGILRWPETCWRATRCCLVWRPLTGPAGAFSSTTSPRRRRRTSSGSSSDPSELSRTSRWESLSLWILNYIDNQQTPLAVNCHKKVLFWDLEKQSKISKKIRQNLNLILSCKT